MKLDLSMLSILGALVAPPLAFLLAVFFDRHQRRKTEKPPQAEKLLRPPGYSLSLRLDTTFDALIDHLLSASLFSVLSSAGVIALAWFMGLHAPVSYSVVSLLALTPFVAGSIWATLRAFRLFKETQNIRLGLRGEQAVAEALNEAAQCGFRTFHDLQTDKVGNIDHITVGPRGVFLIETKARRRRPGRGDQATHEVIFDGASLQFPRGKETKPLEQAKWNAAWLANYLEKKTGEAVRVEPLVVLPGWFVRITAKGNFSVKAMNATYLVRFLQGQPETIPSAQVRRIITALDEKCRDVEF